MWTDNDSVVLLKIVLEELQHVLAKQNALSVVLPMVVMEHIAMKTMELVMERNVLFAEKLREQHHIVMEVGHPLMLVSIKGLVIEVDAEIRLSMLLIILLRSIMILTTTWNVQGVDILKII